MDAKVGEAYEGTVKMAQGARNITYSFKEDSEIPEGITLSTDGTLTGTPTVAGVYDMTIVASADGLIGEEFTVTLFVEGAQAGGCAGSGSSTLLSIAAAILACGALLVTQTVRRRKTGESQKI